MRDVMLVETTEEASAVLNPLRLELLRRADEPRTCAQLAAALGETSQKIYYHVKVLEAAGAIERVEERRVHGIPEAYYRATARSYWLSPKLVGRIGGVRRARDHMSLGFLLSLVEDLQADVGRLAETKRDETPSLGFTAQVRLAKSADRTAFLSDLQNAIQSIAKKYGAVGSPTLATRESAPDAYRLVFACYPRPEEKAVS
ncbi:MAG TPA: helix-turn-helix domain-containing protein [Candidatus Binatia bacterium]|nr:helix-turn-helix domain-containing protein [Candidatus Binatia bacterium]